MSEGEEGVLYLEHPAPLEHDPRTLLEVLADQAESHPEDIMFEQEAAQGWEQVSFAEVLRRSEELARDLSDSGLAKGDVVVFIARNSIQYALMSFAVMACGAVQAALAPQMLSRSPEQVTELCRSLRAVMAVTDKGEANDETLGVRVFELPASVARMDEVPSTPLSQVLSSWRQRVADIQAGDIAKILFTSGSTGSPKGVVNTYGMISAAQKIQSQQFAALHDPDGDRYSLVDWLPWHHTYGGNSNFYSVLWQGGRLTLDSGRPMPGEFDKTLSNIRRQPPNAFNGVPSSIANLVDALERDEDFAARLFSRLKAVSNGGAALNASLVTRLQQLAKRWRGEAVLIGGGYGMTETCAVVTQIWWPDAHPHTLGLPPPGIRLKLVPLDAERYECRVKGPNVTPGYFSAGHIVSQGLFDEEGFFRTGDSLSFVDPAHPETGLSFAGRLKEEFKLANGTWVRSGQLRADLVDALSRELQDAIVVGENRDAPGALLWLRDEVTMTEVEEKLRLFNEGRSVSRRIAFAAVLRHPPIPKAAR